LDYRLQVGICTIKGKRPDEDYRKNSSFFPNPAGPDANLTLTPTTMHLDIAQEIEDYSLKVGMMVIGV
jgi:hypothetical protein